MIILSLFRSLVMTAFFILHTIFFSSLQIILNLIFRSKKIDDRIVTLWGNLTCLSFGVKYTVHNPERIPSGGCLFLFNHSSYFDIFVLVAAFKYLRFGAKSELFKIPFFGPAIKRAGTLPIARNNREEVFKIYEEAKPRFARGEKFALSPEGGRFYGKTLSSFKAGPFVFAMSGSVPLLPVVIVGAYQVLPLTSYLANWKHWQRHIDIYILDPISTKNYSVDQRHELQKIVYDQMNPLWEKYNPEF
jgi:1-acyl-sn-glycerol-3-phosphate acyltransferase